MNVFSQLALRSHGIEGLQQYRPEQLLRRDGRPLDARVEACKIAFHQRERIVHQPPDRAQRMIVAHPALLDPRS
jgi:hypothetical protein